MREVEKIYTSSIYGCDFCDFVSSGHIQMRLHELFGHRINHQVLNLPDTKTVESICLVKNNEDAALLAEHWGISVYGNHYKEPGWYYFKRKEEYDEVNQLLPISVLIETYKNVRNEWDAVVKTLESLNKRSSDEAN